MKNRTILLIGILACGGPAAAQRTWVVDLLNRPGTDFLDLPAAVAAAAPGDVLRVRYADPMLTGVTYTAPAVTKGLSIVGEGPQRPIVTGDLQVMNLPRGPALVAAYLDISTINLPPFPTPPGVSMLFRDNAAPVHLEDIQFRCQFCRQFSPDALFERCDLVTIAHSTLFSLVTSIEFRDCNVFLTDTRAWAPQAHAGVFAFPPPLFFFSSECTLVDCDVRGAGEGWVAGNLIPPTGAIGICNTLVRVAGPQTSIRGGAWMSTGNPTWGISPIFLCSPPRRYEVILDPRSSVSGIDRFIQVSIRYVTAPKWDVDAANSTLTATLYAPPNALTLLMAGLPTPTPWPSPVGSVFLDPFSMVVLDLGPTDGQGIRTRSFSLFPGLPPGTTAGLQGLSLSGGSLELSTFCAPTAR